MERKLLKTMMQSFYEYDGNEYDAGKINKMKKDALISEVREYLKGRRYMIVFDDVWDKNFWESVEFALPKNGKKSRIIITTRDKGVAEFCGSFAPIHIHQLEPLLPNDALRLFRLKAFQFDPKGYPEQLMKLSEDFVKKCDGVPLAIVAIAGLLSTKKKTVSAWKRIYESLHSKLASDPHLESFHQVLSESYNDLPYHLKLCLLYVGLFPEDCSINCERLIYLWIAEGFVKQNEDENQTLEEVAEEYLAELIQRSLVKVSQLYSYGKVRRCRVHDLMHDFILKKCKELNFCQVIKNKGFNFYQWTRRLSIVTNDADAYLRSANNYDRVRSCFGFNFQDLPERAIRSLLSNFKLLIALDFEDAPLHSLPEAVKNFLHLKYLNLRNTKIKTIPKFVGKLQNLETLDLRETPVRELPVEIKKLIKLRNLMAYSFGWDIHLPAADSRGVKLHEGIGRLQALEILLKVDTTNGDHVIKELIELKQMRRLGIIKLRKGNGRQLCNAIEGMKYLCSLRIEAAKKGEALDLHSMTNPPQDLQRLYLGGRLKTLPKWIPKLKNLVYLGLNCSGLGKDPLSILKDLSELASLSLCESYAGSKLHFGNGWFEKLKVLELVSMQILTTLNIEKGALPLLEDMKLATCPQMKEVPAGIGELQTLKFLQLKEMPDEFIKETKGESYRSVFKNKAKVIYIKKRFYLHSA